MVFTTIAALFGVELVQLPFSPQGTNQQNATCFVVVKVTKLFTTIYSLQEEGVRCNPVKEQCTAIV